MEKGHRGIIHICWKGWAQPTGCHDAHNAYWCKHSPPNTPLQSEYKAHFPSSWSLDINCVKYKMYCGSRAPSLVYCLTKMSYITTSYHTIYSTVWHWSWMLSCTFSFRHKVAVWSQKQMHQCTALDFSFWILMGISALIKRKALNLAE